MDLNRRFISFILVFLLTNLSLIFFFFQSKATLGPRLVVSVSDIRPPSSSLDSYSDRSRKTKMMKKKTWNSSSGWLEAAFLFGSENGEFLYVLKEKRRTEVTITEMSTRLRHVYLQVLLYYVI